MDPNNACIWYDSPPMDHIKHWKLDDFFSTVVEFHNQMAEAINQQKIEYKQDYKNIVIHLLSASIVTIQEILQLCAKGYPDGAYALSRNLYEQFIHLAFFESHKDSKDFQEYIDNYYLNYEVQRLKILKFEAEHLEHDTALSNSYRDKINSITGKNTPPDYWWSGETSFNAMCTVVLNAANDCQPLVEKLRLLYKEACLYIHSNTFGIINRLGGHDPGSVDPCPRADGHEYPLHFAAMSFIYLVGVASQAFQFDSTHILDTLNKLALYYVGMLPQKSQPSEPAGDEVEELT